MSVGLEDNAKWQKAAICRTSLVHFATKICGLGQDALLRPCAPAPG